MKSTKLYHCFTNFDLLIVSVWSLFTMRYTFVGFEGIALIVIARIALSFEMRRRSPWTLYSAIIFALIAFSCVWGYAFNQTFHRMMFHLLWLTLGTQEAMSGFHPLDPDLQVWIYCLLGFWVLWFAVLPVIVGFKLKNIKQIEWKKKAIWVYVGVCATFCAAISIAGAEVGVDIFIYLMACLPIVYWTKYQRAGRSLIEVLMANKGIMSYIGAWLIIWVAYISPSFSLMALTVLPLLFYIVVSKAYKGIVVRTIPTLLMAVAGWLCWSRFHFDTPQWWNVTLISLAVAIVLYVAIDLVRRYKKWFAATVLFFGTTMVVIPITLGLNPYSVTEAMGARDYHCGYSPTRGIFITYGGNGHYGLRDRYDMIVQPEYDKFERIGNAGNFVLFFKEGGIIRDCCYGVYDINARKFVINPNSVDIIGVEKIDDIRFKLINSDGRWFATLKLPGFSHEWKNQIYEPYSSELSIEPHFSDAETPFNDFLFLAENMADGGEDEIEKNMKASNPRAYRLLSKLIAMAKEECSPKNDRNFYIAFRHLVKEDPVYRGNIDKAVSDIDFLLDILWGGTNGDMNKASDISRLLSNIRLAKNYDEMLMSIPAGWQEYTAWHNLTEAMANHFIDYQYKLDDHSALPQEINWTIKKWLDDRTKELATEYGIIAKNADYVAPDSIGERPKIEDIFGYYSQEADMGNYDPLWHEVRPAYISWIESRDSVASSLPKKQAMYYNEMTKEVAIRIANDIKNLHQPAEDGW